jgi:phage/plasmid-like protein (TIGR03299 family)
MAHTGAAPWHRLGSALPPRQPLSVWAEKAGMEWEILDAPVLYRGDSDDPSAVHAFDEQRFLYRSDSKAALSAVSRRYRVVQPRAVLEFYRDLSEVAGYDLETGGVLKGGRKFWALARMGKEVAIKRKDVVRGYILLATSCDGTLATTATPTTVRVVCNNTLTMALNGATGAVKAPHSTSFDADDVQRQLGIAVSGWDEFMYRMKKLSERKLRVNEVEPFLRKVLGGSHVSTNQPVSSERAMKRVLALFEAQGQGAEQTAAHGTAWGLLTR